MYGTFIVWGLTVTGPSHTAATVWPSGAARATTFVTAGQLTAVITAADILPSDHDWKFVGRATPEAARMGVPRERRSRREIDPRLQDLVTGDAKVMARTLRTALADPAVRAQIAALGMVMALITMVVAQLSWRASWSIMPMNSPAHC